ncbi:hypothetical protein JCM10908_003329 [Rhodotorula pacifica]|uniref:GNAT family N-acetyltransferase n=1 Tax=Rhodotorula pacifica TaxID=1495444 RepID=UPI0031826259
MLAPCSFRSDRLIYRALDPEADQHFVLETLNDPGTQLGVNWKPTRPLSRRNVANLAKHVDGCLLAVMFCLPSEEDASKAGTAVGWMHLEPFDSDNPQNRCARFAITLNKSHQGRGYGGEAMEWLLRRAFVGHGLNRVESGCWAWNEAAVRLYKKVGFTVEGIRRQACWQEGAFRDEVIVYICFTLLLRDRIKC